jgi:hypothetical protein
MISSDLPEPGMSIGWSMRDGRVTGNWLDRRPRLKP